MKFFKKSALVLAALFVMGSAFGAEKIVGINFTMPSNKLTMKTDYGSGYYKPVCIGIGINALSGNVYTSVDLGFAQKLETSVGTASKEDLKNAKMSIITLDFLAGLGFKIVDGDLQFILAPGIHYTMYSEKSSGDQDLYFTLGLGAEAMLNYYFTNTIGLTGSFGFAYDFFGFGTGNSSGEIKYSTLSLVPRVGVVIKY